MHSVIVAGGREFDDYELLKKELDRLLMCFEAVEIVSGTAYGTDRLGERYANEKGFSIKRFPANWDLGKSAGYIRNKQMRDYADSCICFWDGKSKGTKHMIDLANKIGMELTVINYKDIKKDSIEIFCDGGCRGNSTPNDNIGSWGIYMSYGEKTREIGGVLVNTTNNKAELQAVIECLKLVDGIHDVDINIHLDSAYVLNGVTNWVHGWKKNNWKTSAKKDVLNKELWIELDNLNSKFGNIKYIKVKGHSGVDGNEMADRVCNRMMDEYEKNNK